MRSEKWFFVLFVALYAATCAIVANAEPATVRFQNPGTATYAALRTKWGTVPVSCAGGATCSVVLDLPIGSQTVTAEATVDGVTWSGTSNAIVKLVPPAPAQCLAQASCRFDADVDGQVSGSDFSAFVAAFGSSWIPKP